MIYLSDIIGGDFYYMKSRTWQLVIVLILFVSVLYYASVEKEQQSLAEKLIRLHVVAASDEPEAQELKLKIRDEVLGIMSPILDGCKSREQAENILERRLHQIKQIAEDCAREYGRQSDIAVTLDKELFDARQYPTFALPAGEYSSLKIVIGEGSGKNWWCVVFPPLCIEAVSEFGTDSEGAFAELTEDEVELITGEDDEYVIKFKILEVIEKLRNLFKQ